MKYPSFIYGTAWKEQNTSACVQLALKAGFRAIDTANQRKHYFEQAVGDAIKTATLSLNLKREDLFLQTKYTFQAGQDQRLPYDPNASIDEQVIQSFKSSLEHLQTDYLDSYLLHGPSGYDDLSEEDWTAWRSMEKLFHERKTKSIGVSNFNLLQLTSLVEEADIKPAFVQNRCFAKTLWDKEIRTFCNKNQIKYQGFSLLTANPNVFRTPIFQNILKATDYTPAQIVFCYSRQIGILPITGTTNAQHMNEDLISLTQKLSSSQLDDLEKALEPNKPKTY